MIAQSFDEAMTSRLRELIFNPATAQLGTSNMHELSLSLYESPAFLGFQEQVLGDLKKKLSQTIGQWTKSTSPSQAR
jgi:hypothetical protein